MKLNIGKKELLNALSKVEKALTRDNGIKLELSDVLTLIATNREIMIDTTIEDLDVIEVGEALISGKLFVDIVKKVEGKIIKIETLENGKISIKSGKSKFVMTQLDLKLFPQFYEKEWVNRFELNSKKLLSLIKKTIVATSTSNTRPILQGVNFKTKDNMLIATATDSFRVAKDYVEIDSNNAIDVVIPATSLNELIKILDTEKVMLELNNTYARFTFEDTVFETKLIAGEFPKVDGFFNSSLSGFYTINRSGLISALERANIILDTNSTQIVKLDLKRNLVEISTIQNEIGQAYEEIECDSNGVELSMGVSAKNLLDALKTFDTDVITVGVEGETKPFIIKSEKENLRQLILPVRLA